jgi:hypothetical protein
MKRPRILQSLLFGMLTCVGSLVVPRPASAQFQKGGTIGLVNARYLWESGGHSTFQGGTFLIGFTIARPMTN